jgi:catechol 2,3-dioxygenase-like lactoylglutathione lyase family enzyme
MAPTEVGFDYRGINHLALVCRDMERTVHFYTTVLGMPLVKTIELPARHWASTSSSTAAVVTRWRSSGSPTPRRRRPGWRPRPAGPTRAV